MGSHFLTTQWTVIFQAGQSRSEEGAQAFERLCRDYWQPLYAFTRASGATHEDGQDITQGFFQYLLENEMPSDVHPTKGRFRSWLLAVLKNFLAADHRNRTRLKRGGPDLKIVTLDDAHDELVDSALPSESYEREWARSVMANALERLKLECQHAGQTDRFEVLRACLFDVSKGEGATQEHALALGTSLNAAKIALSRLRQRYRELLRTEVSRLVEDPADVDEEITHLIRVLSS